MSSKEIRYLGKLDIRPYIGMWIAIYGEEVIAYGKDLKDVHKRARKMTGGKTPFLKYVGSGKARTCVL